jgi:xylan 1,4-beta-xylosidase
MKNEISHIIKASILSLVVALTFNAVAQTNSVSKLNMQTFCNPLNLPYNFQREGVTRREAADPVIVLFKDKYWLFASKQAGYWYSDDLVNWHFVQPVGLPLDVYAPAVSVVDGKLCYTSGNSNGTFTTEDPLIGKWVNINPYKSGCNDPDVFQDNDGKVYLYDGCSDKNPLYFTELDRHSFLPVGAKTPAIYADVDHHGWEVSGEHNRGKTEGHLSLKSAAPWIEGSWMNKISGRYYLQYAAPGTQFKTYADGVYVSDQPTGPFIYQSYSPFSFKPTGFIAGAGHSCTFLDKNNQYWHIATATISIRHDFERRLVLFPTGLLPDGQLVTNTYLGDYPQLVPGSAKDQFQNNSPQWMLLSYNKPASASSILMGDAKQNFIIKNAFDENIQTWWSATTGNKGEWLQVDLQKRCRVNAIQVNFADQGCMLTGPLGNDGYSYFVEASSDGQKWTTIINRGDKVKDTPHDYIQLDQPVMARYLRITNVHYPAKGSFSLSGFRVFGSALGKLPAAVKNISVARNPADQRCVHVSWQAKTDADFYIVRYGIKPDRLFSNYQVYHADNIDINALNVGTAYYFTVDAVNATGITKGRNPLNKY